MIVWTEYLKYRAKLRGFDLAHVEQILRHSGERYDDQATGRLVAVGRSGATLVLVPYETEGESVIPVTVHRTTRQQVTARLKSGRYLHV